MLLKAADRPHRVIAASAPHRNLYRWDSWRAELPIIVPTTSKLMAVTAKTVATLCHHALADSCLETLVSAFCSSRLSLFTSAARCSFGCVVSSSSLHPASGTANNDNTVRTERI